MKTRTVSMLLVFAALLGMALAQVPAVNAVLAPLSGRDREIVVETFHSVSIRDTGYADTTFAGYPTAQAFFRGRAEGYEQASNFLKNYVTPSFQTSHRVTVATNARAEN